MKERIWNEERIREEMRRLDKKTGLHGAELPIRFGAARSYLGYYMLSINDQKEHFYFSDAYFQDPQFMEEEALDVIRHEYAHYMNHEVYGGDGHDTTWKMCCKAVGANPLRRYNLDRQKYLKRKHERESEISEMCDVFQCGMEIVHPSYGNGRIVSIDGVADKRTLKIEFRTAGEKRLSAGWVFVNCKFA